MGYNQTAPGSASKLWPDYAHIMVSERLSASETDDPANSRVVLQGTRELDSLGLATLHYSSNLPEFFYGGLHCRS